MFDEPPTRSESHKAFRWAQDTSPPAPPRATPPACFDVGTKPRDPGAALPGPRDSSWHGPLSTQVDLYLWRHLLKGALRPNFVVPTHHWSSSYPSRVVGRTPRQNGCPWPTSPGPPRAGGSASSTAGPAPTPCAAR